MAVTTLRIRWFWIHQAAEYALGGLLLVQGLQSPNPALPALAGALLLVNAAIAQGPLSAYRLVGRRLHRILDWVVVGVLAVGALAPRVDAMSRLLMLLGAVGLAVLTWRTDWRPARGRSGAPPPAPDAASEVAPEAAGPPAGGPAGRSRWEDLTRGAGRLTAKGAKEARRRLE